MGDSGRIVFVIGAPRSGTTWVHAMLGAHPEICATGELMLFNMYTTPWIQSWRTQCALGQGGGNTVGLPLVWSEDDLRDFLREFLRRAYAPVWAAKPEATVLVDKHPGYSGHVEYIEELCPKSRYIHVVRDGRDVVGSILAASQGWGRPWAAADVEEAAATWRAFVREGRKASRFGNRHIEVRYEDLLRGAEDVLATMCAFAGVSNDPDLVRNIVEEHGFERMKSKGSGAGGAPLPKGFFREGTSGGWRSALSPRSRYLVRQIAGDTLRELGYADDEAWWADGVAAGAALPLWALVAPAYRRQHRRRAVLRLALGDDRSRYPDAMRKLLMTPRMPGLRRRLRRAAADVRSALFGRVRRRSPGREEETRR